MLTYTLTGNDICSSLTPIKVAAYVIDEDYSDEQSLVTFYSTEDIPVVAGGHVVFSTERTSEDYSTCGIYDYSGDSVEVDDGYVQEDVVIVPEATPDAFRNVVMVAGVDQDERSFNLILDKRWKYELSAVSRVNVKSADGTSEEKYVYVYIDGKHYFKYSESTPTIWLKYRMTDGSEDFVHESGEESPKDIPVEIVNKSTVRFKLSEIPEVVQKLLFDRPGWNADFGDKNAVEISREQFFLTDEDNYTIQYDAPIAELKVPVSQRFAVDTLQDENIQEHFVDEERRKAINRIAEMEKDVYHPVIPTALSGMSVEDCYKIKINLHFREHEGEDWLAPAESMWNGVENGTIKDGFSPIYKSRFEDVSGQSDLLTYLGFTVNDIRYQKNRLKKSFIRLMFYDSMSPSNQNMLCYATVFIDSGKAFMTYVRNIASKDYRTTEKTGLIGARPDREPTDKTESALGIEFTEDNIEDYRISSQFVIKGREHSDACSEGFYLYLWKDNFLGSEPQDIYMKAEFNHAGYGRTIPLMMPYWDEGKDGKNGIKTFEEIISDFQSDTTSYGVRKYMRYSYVRWKYRYDKKSGRHVYYLDPETYGSDVLNCKMKDNTITLNLYEAKIGNPE